jgi:hypothetical protein
MKLLILEDMVYYLDRYLIPDNIEVIATSKIDDELDDSNTTKDIYD